LKPPRLLDLFCGAGGAAMGYHRAGFEVVGVDNKPQPNYPFEFYEKDAFEALAVLGPHFDAFHASPPCQKYSVATNIHNGQPWKKEHPDYVAATRARLAATKRPFVMENVPGAPLQDYIILCGTMFPELKVYRHRLFECHGFKIKPPGPCNHTHRMGKSKGEYHALDKSPYITCAGHNFQARSGRIAMGVPWMTRAEIAQAIPPAYTEYIGRELLTVLKRKDNR